MIDADISELHAGFAATIALYKQGEDVTSMGSQKLLPTFNVQAKWHYAKVPDGLHLHNPVDNVTYHFAFPHGTHDTDPYEAQRKDDKAYSDFAKDATNKGTLQVHRADPGSIYFTMHDGTDNPTMTIRHVGGEKWQVLPKKRTSKPKTERIAQTKMDVEQVKTAFAKVASDMLGNEQLPSILGGNDIPGKAHMLDPVALGAKGIEGTAKGVWALGANPWASLAGGAALGALYDQGKRHLYNTEKENEAEGTGQRLLRVGAPAAAFGGIGALLHGMRNNPA